MISQNLGASIPKASLGVVLASVICGFAVSAWAASAWAADAAPATTKPPTQADWAKLGQLPDWGGVWLPDQPDEVRRITTDPTPWNPVAAKKIETMRADERAGHPHGIFVNCLSQGMPSWMLITHNELEFLFTPGRVTMLGEGDGSRLRRIYTDGRGHPEDPDPTLYGHSIGHWEGDTLVVDTVGIDPAALIALGEAVGVPNNGDMHVVEHIHQVGPDALHDDLEITAPHVLTRPWKTTRIFTRQRDRSYDIAEGACLQESFKEIVNADGDAVYVRRALTADGNRAPEK